MRRLARILAWLGLAASLTCVVVGLVYYADLMRPFWKGSAAQYWSGVAGVPVANGENRYGLPAPLGMYPHRYFHNDNRVGSIPLHGQHYQEVTESAVLAVFPEVIDRLITDPTELDPDQVRVLVRDENVSKDEGLARLAADRAAIGRSLERMRDFIRASHKARLARGLAEFGPKMAAWQTRESGWLSVWVGRADRYWANIAFEAAFLGGLVVLFWLPILSARCRRWMAVLWGCLPVLLLVPYYLGYCWGVFVWPDASFWGGVLYPWILRVLEPMSALRIEWEGAVLRDFPRALAPLNQLPIEDVFDIRYGLDGPGILAPLAIGLAIGLAAFGVQRFVRRWRDKHAPTKVGG